MDGLLSISSTRRLSRPDETLSLVERPKTATIESSLQPETTDDVLRILQSKPTYDELVSCLRWMNKSAKATGAINIHIPSPKSAEVLNVLVNTILPDYWEILRGEQDNNHSKERRSFVRCLTSVAGIGALATRLKNIVASNKILDKSKASTASKDNTILRDVFEVFEQMFDSDNALAHIARDLIAGPQKQLQKTLALKELVTWVASGRLVSIAAEAESISHEIDGSDTHSWLADGKAYSQWLGRCINALPSGPIPENGELLKLRSQLFSKALSIGYRDEIVGAVFAGLLDGDVDQLAPAQSFIATLPNHEQKTVIFSLLRLAPSSHSRDDIKAAVGGVSALLSGINQTLPSTRSILIDWLVERNSGSINENIVKHRAVMIVLGQDLDIIERATARLLETFADKLYIEHSPILHQEIQAQDLLLAVGHLHTVDQGKLRAFARSGPYINAVSNRLAASSARSRFLGMVVGVAVSELVDEEDKRMNFDTEEVNGDEGKWYRDLVKVKDRVGSIEDLKFAKHQGTKPVKAQRKTQGPVKLKPSVQLQPSKIIGIEEIADSESEDEDIPLYEKPDSDPEDSDEDPTVIQRNKPTAPVYIRDLILGLRDDDNYDRHRLALYTAADLIRRKSKFGTEVSEHSEELASRLAGLRDAFELDNFEEKRLQAMIAIIIALPLPMGKWFSVQLFTGDYSMAQRASILTAISMAARELAGYREEDASLTGAHTDPEDLFPSKRLPKQYDPAFKAGVSSISALAEKMENTMIKPMAAAAADKVTGPDILKVRTFSSRMEVEKKRKRPITNELAKIVAESFFFPLTGRFKAHMQAHGSSSPFAVPFLLSHFLRTLAIVMSASGKSTLSLPALTTEFWNFLLPLRPEASKAKPVLEAILFCFLSILEINSDDQRQVAQDHSQELLETQSWAQQVFDNTRGGEKEGERVRMLAASIMVKCAEVVEKYQQVLMGDLVNYM